LLESLNGVSDTPFEIPKGIVTLDVDTVSGLRAHDGFPSRSEFFIDGTEPSGQDPIHAKLKVCKASGKLATPIDISRGDYEEKEFFVLKENDPTGGKNGVNLWQLGIDEWIKTQTDGRYHPPTEYCSSANDISVEFIEPKDRTTVNSNDVKIRVEPIPSSNVKNIEIFVDGASRANFTSGPYEVTVYMENGTHTIKAVFEEQNGKKTEREIKIGVNVPWDYAPSVSPTIIPTISL
jgi:hypothetical protein